MRKLLLLVVLTILLLSVLAFAGHTRPSGKAQTSVYCECSESPDDICYSDETGEPLPLCDQKKVK
jgi:hypothetical protein